MNTAPSRDLADELLSLVATRFRLLGDPTRLKLLEALPAGERTGGELAKAAGTSQANASKHLAALLEAGIVARRRSGGNAFYNVNGRVVYLLIDAVHSALDSQAKQRRDILAAARPHEIADGRQG